MRSSVPPQQKITLWRLPQQKITLWRLGLYTKEIEMLRALRFGFDFTFMEATFQGLPFPPQGPLIRIIYFIIPLLFVSELVENGCYVLHYY